ncbi:MAG: hypothetical protein JSR98_21990 [Proteobacteria bacterium]|nr:hypothetical protein [Pseudomonadota bacterium]
MPGERSSSLSADQRLTALLALSDQRRRRFQELEQIQWRINFSIWAALGGLAYLWAAGHLIAPRWLLAPMAYFLAPIPPVLIHGAAVIKLTQQQLQLSDFAHKSSAIVYNMLDLEVLERPKSPRRLGLTGRAWFWVGWSVTVTASLTSAIVVLAQHVALKS